VFDQTTLKAIREAHDAAIDEAMLKAQRGCFEFASMPNSLVAVSIWLSWQRFAALPTEGERYFAWPLARVRRYMRRLSATALAAEIEMGRRVIFEGVGQQEPLLKSAPASVDGQPVSAFEAEKLRQLGRRTLGVRWAA